ncbi:GDYXXLXY domain-containing protein [Gelidibacter sediminis]|nr:GDYXXLXY domain-containing protein [Gelidibacter sediminis]
MKTIPVFLIFVAVVLAQLFVPAKMIFDQEKVISKGTAYKFKTAPVDPSDPFKGKYIYLNYELNSAASTDSTWVYGAPIYLSLATDSLGFAKLHRISKDTPNHQNYVKAKVNWYSAHEKTVTFSLPFDEFYMNETKAYDAEIAHVKAQRDSVANNTYALVYVLNGRGVLENVFINNIPIAEYVEKE